MADGNYNRTHLPNRPYLSGIQAGRAQMHALALRAFEQWLDEQDMNEEEKQRCKLRFHELLTL